MSKEILGGRIGAGHGHVRNLPDAASHGGGTQIQTTRTERKTLEQVSAAVEPSWVEIRPEDLLKDGKTACLKRFTVVNDKGSFALEKFGDSQDSFTIAANPGANILDLRLGGEQIITSPIPNNKFTGKHSASGYQGMPLLFPPNRIGGNTVTVSDANNNQTQINLNDVKEDFRLDGSGNIIHGRLFKLAWKQDRIEVSKDGGIRVTYSFDTKDDSVLKSKFGEAQHKITYTLCKNTAGNSQLIVDISVKNNGNKTYPLIGFGLHPYFKTSPGDTFTIPAKKVYINDKDKLPQLLQAVENSEYNLRSPKPVDHKVSGNFLDDVFTDLELDQGSAGSSIKKANGKEVYIKQSRAFNHITVCNQDGSICIEPQSCATDAANAKARGLAEASPKFLNPGETFKGRVIIGLKTTEHQY